MLPSFAKSFQHNNVACYPDLQLINKYQPLFRILTGRYDFPSVFFGNSNILGRFSLPLIHVGILRVDNVLAHWLANISIPNRTCSRAVGVCCWVTLKPPVSREPQSKQMTICHRRKTISLLLNYGSGPHTSFLKNFSISPITFDVCSLVR